MPRWNCQLCPWSFERKSDLTRHEKKHTGEKPHVCETCDKGFVQRSGLVTHWNVHTRKKPHICGIGTCKKAFGDPSSCSRHRRETHSNESYKCIVADCGTRIKRRTAFKNHLRKHGLDPDSLDLNATTREGKVPTTRPSSPDVEDSSHHDMDSRSVFPTSRRDSLDYRLLTDESQTSDFVDGSGWIGDGPVVYRWADLYPASHSLLGTMLGQTADIDPPALPPDDYAYLSSDIESQFYCDGIFSPIVNFSLFTAPPLDLEPFLEASSDSDGSQSSWSSPSSTYSTLYTTDSNNDVMSQSLANNTFQEPLLP